MPPFEALPGDPPAATRRLICQLIDDHRRELRMSQRELGELMGVSQAQASRWCKYQEPRLDDVVAIEKHLGLARGSLLRAAGYVADDHGVLAAIQGDPDLSPRSREVLSEVYRGLWRHEERALGEEREPDA